MNDGSRGVEPSKEEAIGLLSDLKGFEEEVAESLGEYLKRTQNNVVKLLIHGIILDSLKHADLLQALIDLRRGHILADVDKYEVQKGLDEHISKEEEMLGRVESLSRKIGDEKTRRILEQITLEEKRHHEGLKQLNSIIQSIEAITPEEWWEYMNRWANFST